jgi:hypothetical protein
LQTTSRRRLISLIFVVLDDDFSLISLNLVVPDINIFINWESPITQIISPELSRIEEIILSLRLHHMTVEAPVEEVHSDAVAVKG